MICVMTTFAERPERPLRADALRNRAKILQAAAEVFAEHGLDVTLDDIAHHAGVGVGTVYRRFADREALIEALFEVRMKALLQRMRDALDDPDPWHGLITFVEGVCALIATDRGMRQVMLSSAYGQGEVAQCRDEFGMLGEQLVSRVKATGMVRPDFEVTDVFVLFLLIGSVTDFAGEVDPQLWRRYFDIMIDGLRAQPGQGRAPELAPALDQQKLDSAMRCWRPMRRR
jgi:AcrR family transcriptional regulator